MLFIFVTVCLYTDLTERKIYNSVVLGGLGAAFIINIIQHGLMDGVLFSLTGFFTGIFLLVIPFIIGGLGAGDVKMLGTIGAFMGYALVVDVLVVSALIGGIYALLMMIKERGVIRRLVLLFTGFALFTLTGKAIYLRNLQDEKREKAAVPYGAALALGVIVIYVMGSFEYSISLLSMPR